MWIEASSLSELGKESTCIEDYCSLDSDEGVFVVADGMGGRPRGDLASETAVTAFVTRICQLTGSDRLHKEGLCQIVKQVDEDVRGLSKDDPD